MSRPKARCARVAALLLLVAAESSGAATIWVVTTNGEPATLATNDCSGTNCTTLRGAINAAASGDTIRFSPSFNNGFYGI